MAPPKPRYTFGDDTKNICRATNRGSSDEPVPVAPLMFTSLGYYFLILVAVTW
jgi:hypothetical protein